MINIDIALLTLNEEKYLDRCITSVINFEIPDNVVTNIYIIDGGSTDKTLDIANSYIKKNKNIVILDNVKKIQSSAMNILILEGKGEYILRLDAHTVFEKDYLSNCLETSLRTDADNVGGILNTLPGSGSYGAKVVQALSSHPFGVGNSGFRIGAQEGPVDTVPFGFFKRSIFSKIGNFNEKLLRAQDYEFNRRIIKSGGTIWLNPKIKADYYNQPSLVDFFRKIFFLEAPYNAYMWFFAPYTFSIRHSITVLFFLGCVGGTVLGYFFYQIYLIFSSVMILYFLLALISSIQLTKRHKEMRHILVLPITFFFFHFIHGMGIVLGIKNILFRSIPKASG
ncbi:glycosyltransferase family 2 protein [Gammaproteobacteria bacterium]|nr:glycosyltransferase family 2 protein [Gammaproteobacteria bacterium]